jgi:hypothetical protein
MSKDILALTLNLPQLFAEQITLIDPQCAQNLVELHCRPIAAYATKTRLDYVSFTYPAVAPLASVEVGIDSPQLLLYIGQDSCRG